LALLAAGNTVLAAAMRQWQREAGGQPPTKNGRMREDGELPQINAATAAISAKRFLGVLTLVGGMVDFMTTLVPQKPDTNK